MLKKILAVLAMLFTVAAMAAVDVNKGTAADLDGIKGIGPGTTKLIMDQRKKGEFKDWADFIKRVKGVGEVRAAKLSDEGLTVNGEAFKKAAKKDEKKAEKKEEKKEDKKADKKDDKKKDDKAAGAKPAASAKK